MIIKKEDHFQVNMKDLYTKEFMAIMQSNAVCSKLRTNRIEEIKNFAQELKFTRIGIAHFISFSHEAKVLSAFLAKHFDVYAVDCKYGKITKLELLGGDSKRILCNPAGQADFLNNHNTELNISMGLCVGHDMIFSKLSNGLVTNLFDKDFTNKHNPTQAINELKVCN